MNKYRKHYTDQKKPDTKEYVQYDSVYMKP